MVPEYSGEGASARRPLCALTLLLALLAASCVEPPSAPVAPSWDVTITLPLVHRSHDLSEILTKSPGMLRAGEGGLITYAAGLAAAPVVLGDLIRVVPPDTTVALSFGPFAISAPPLAAGISLALLPPGATVDIPDTTVPAPDIALSIPTFEEITFAEGLLRLTLRNNLPVPVDVPASVAVLDGTGRPVASFAFGTVIPPGEERSAIDDVSDRTALHDLLITGLQLHLAASGGPVTLPQGDLLRVTLEGEGLRARTAVLADIPAQRLVDNDRALLPLDDSTLVREALFSSGRLRLLFTNRVPLGMTVSFRISALSRDAGGGRPYVDSLVLPAGGSGTHDLDFTRLRLTAQSADFLRDLELVSTINLPTGSGGPVTVHDTDKVIVTVTTIAPLVVDTATAVIRPTWLAVDEPVAVDFGSWPTRFTGALEIPSASLRLGTSLSFGFPTDLYISIGARRTPGGSWVYLHVPATQKRIQPGASAITFDNAEVGAFLSEFAGGLPDSLYIQGLAHVNPPEVYRQTLAGAGVVGARSAIQGSVALEIPLRLGLTGGRYADTLSLGDTTGDGHQDYPVNKDRVRGVREGTMYIDVENGLPLAINLRARLLDRSRLTLLTVPGITTSVHVPAAAIDGNGGTISPTRVRRSITLLPADVRQFDPAEFAAYEVDVETPQGAGAVQFRIEDYVRVRIWSTFGYRVTP